MVAYYFFISIFLFTHDIILKRIVKKYFFKKNIYFKSLVCTFFLVNINVHFFFWSYINVHFQ